MQNLQDWFLKQQHSAKRFVSIYDMLFADRVAKYVFFRLGYFNMQIALRFLSHVAIAYVILHTVAYQEIALIILVMAIKMVVMAAWWGGLEVLRTQVRYSYRGHNIDEANEHIGTWLLNAGCLSIAILIGIYIYLHYAWVPNSLKPQQAVIYVVTTLLIIAIQLPVRVFHSGAYAITRIIRPGYSIIFADIVGLVVLFATKPWLYYYAVPFSMLTRAAISQLLTFRYTLRMYDFYDLKPTLPRRRVFTQRVIAFPYIDFVLAALSNVFISFDGILLGVYIGLQHAQLNINSLLTTLFIIAPMLRAGADWARLFYFDWKRQDNKDYAIFIKKYERQLNQATPFVGLFYWLSACIACFAILTEQEIWNCVFLLPLFLLRSKLAVLQMKCFAKYQYYAVITSSLLVITVFIIAYYWQTDILWRGALIVGALILICLLLSRSHLRRRNKVVRQKSILHGYAWLAAVKQELLQKPLRIYRLILTESLNEFQLYRIADYLIDKVLRGNEQICLIKNQLWFFQIQKPHYAELDLSVIAKLTAGYVMRYQYAVITARTSLRAHNIFNSILFAPLPVPSLKKLKQQFFAEFPNALCYSPGLELGPVAQLLEPIYLRAIQFQANAFLYKRQAMLLHSFPYNISVYFRAGKVRCIFIVPYVKRNPEFNKKIKAWRYYLERLNTSTID